MHSIKIDMTISFLSKWHCGSGEGGILADRLVSRDSRNCPYIPGSTLKGVVRDSCEQLSRTLAIPIAPSDPHSFNLRASGVFGPLDEKSSPVDVLFGNKYQGECMFVSDAIMADKPVFDAYDQSRICKSRTLGTAKDKHLFSTEYSLSSKFTNIPLKAYIEGYHESLLVFENLKPLSYCLLVASILNVNRIGGDRSVGGGHLMIVLDHIAIDGQCVSSESVLDNLSDYIEFREIVYPEAAVNIAEVP